MSTCSQCKHWSTGRPRHERTVISDDYLGQCRRHPPVVLQGFEDLPPKGPRGWWPRVRADDFCGEWAASARHEIDAV